MFLTPRHDFLADDTGTFSVEYAVGFLIAIAIASCLLVAVRSETVRDGIADLVNRALEF